jgi:MFS family permease
MYLPQFMAKQLGYSAAQAGAGLLPMRGVFTLTSFVAGPLYGRIGAKAVCAAGALCLGSGVFLLATIHPTSTYPALIPGMVVVGIGVGLYYSSVTTAGITAVDPSRSSLAGAIIYMFQVVGGSIGLGFNTALVVTAPSLSEGIRTAFLVNGALAIAGLAVTVLFVGGRLDREQVHALLHRHRAHG